jgi:hypothetical protein
MSGSGPDVLDLDVTDTPLYGKQEDRFFRGYYNKYCEQNRVDYVSRLARNSRLQQNVAGPLWEAKQEHERTCQATRGAEFSCRTRNSWSRMRRVVAKAEYLEKGENPRFVVTCLPAEAAALYEKTYCARAGNGEPHRGAAALIVLILLQLESFMVHLPV